MSQQESFYRSIYSAAKGTYFPMELCRKLQREIDFAEGERNLVVVGSKVLQEAKRISHRGRFIQDVIFPCNFELNELGSTQALRIGSRTGCTTGQFCQLSEKD